MKLKMSAYRAVVGVALCSAACAELADDDLVNEVSSDLLVSSWSAPLHTGSAYRSGQIATLNGTTYMVSSGYCGAWSCGGSGEADELYWSKFTATGRTSGVRIPNQKSAHKVSLAPFNGFLYMVHTGVSDTSQTWLSRFDPVTEQWTTNFQVPYTSFAGPPAIVAFNNRLHFIGTTPGTFQMWTASMTANELFTTAATLSGHHSASRPSAAVFDGRLYIAHRHGQTGEIVIGSFNGSTWTSPQYVRAGTGGAPIRGVDPALATNNGFLHLIHRRPETNHVWWTYFDGCEWPAEVTLNTLQTSYDPSLTQGGPGLILLTTNNITWNGIIESRAIHVSKFNHPLSPLPLPPPFCDIVISP
jgi:hypothetical protein